MSTKAALWFERLKVAPEPTNRPRHRARKPLAERVVALGYLRAGLFAGDDVEAVDDALENAAAAG